MDDLISRAAAIDYLMTNMGWHDEDGYEVDDADEKRAIITALVNGIPTIDAIPMWWITEKFLDVLNKDKELSKAVWLVRKAWQKEQEVR